MIKFDSIFTWTKNGASTKYLSAALFVLLAVTWSATYVVSEREELNAMESSALHSYRLATFFEGHTASTFKYADDYIKSVRRIFRHQNSFHAVRGFMDEVPPSNAILSHVTIVDADGVPQYISTGKIDAGVHARDRDYFKFQKSNKTDSIYVSTARRGRNSGLLTVRLVRRITNADGQFDGVIFASIKGPQLLSFFDTIRIGQNSSATLVGLDKRIRIRKSQKGFDGIGKEIGRSKLWENLSKSDSGTYRQTSLVDGITRLWTYRKVHGFPVVAVIGTALSDTLAASVDIKAFRYAVATLITVIGIVLVFFARRAIVSTRLETELDERKRAEVLLLSAKEEAEKANAAKSEFLAGMSHDLRTPLNAIIGFSDIMRKETFGPLGGPEYKEYADDIHHSGGLLVSLINDVLDLSKIEAGKYELEEEHLDISSLVQTSIRQLAIMAEASKQVVTSDIKPNGIGLWGENRAMIQLLNNLLSNAIKFTPDGGQVTISTKLNEDKSLHLSVIDTGIGMSEEGITRAMEPFAHAKGSVSRRQAGSGLGLYLCKNLMRLFGGTLNIESRVGQGTTVTLQFPPERTITRQ